MIVLISLSPGTFHRYMFVKRFRLIAPVVTIVYTVVSVVLYVFDRPASRRGIRRRPSKVCFVDTPRRLKLSIGGLALVAAPLESCVYF